MFVFRQNKLFVQRHAEKTSQHLAGRVEPKKQYSIDDPRRQQPLFPRWNWRRRLYVTGHSIRKSVIHYWKEHICWVRDKRFWNNTKLVNIIIFYLKRIVSFWMQSSLLMMQSFLLIMAITLLIAHSSLLISQSSLLMTQSSLLTINAIVFNGWSRLLSLLIWFRKMILIDFYSRQHYLRFCA